MKKKPRFSILLCSVSLCGMILTGCGAAKSAVSDSTISEKAEMNYAAETPEVMEDAAGLTQESVSVTPAVTDRKLIREVSMSVETKDFNSLLTQINTKVTQLKGYTQSADVSGTSLAGDNGDTRHAYLILRIPADQLDDFITDVEANGNITNKTESTTDVSLQYADTQSRKKSLEIEQERIWALLEKADSMETILTLEERLSEIRYELESYESQLRQYDNKVDYSTVTLNISEVGELTLVNEQTVTQRIQTGFSGSLSLLAKSCTDLFVWVISCSPFLIPLAVIIGIILFLILRSNKKSRLQQNQPPVSTGNQQSLPPADTGNQQNQPPVQ